MNRRHVGVVAACAAMLGACTDSSPEARYARFADAHRADISAYATFLRAQGVADVVPLSELLRTGRRWQHCGEAEFAIPARTTWPAIPDTLRLVRMLRAAGAIGAGRVASAWRSDTFNRCEGGSTRSKHLANVALDFDLDVDATARLCDWWRAHGARHRFGLGFYDARRIHVDTAGFRTWGGDYTRRTSRCTAR
jgi:uncharacterized protein YcbK (DUF882 family)